MLDHTREITREVPRDTERKQPPAPDRLQTAGYIAEMSLGLRALAVQTQMGIVADLLESVFYQASSEFLPKISVQERDYIVELSKTSAGR